MVRHPVPGAASAPEGIVRWGADWLAAMSPVRTLDTCQQASCRLQLAQYAGANWSNRSTCPARQQYLQAVDHWNVLKRMYPADSIGRAFGFVCGSLWTPKCM